MKNMMIIMKMMNKKIIMIMNMKMKKMEKIMNMKNNTKMELKIGNLIQFKYLRNIKYIF